VKPTKRNIATSLVVVAMVVVWLFAVWSPRSSEVGAAVDNLEQVEAESERITRQMARAAGELTEGRRGDQSIAELEAALPDDPALARFLRLHRLAAEQAGVVVESISPSSDGGTEAGVGIVGYPIDISAGGDVATVRDYLSRLRTMERVVAVDKFSLEQGGDRSARIQLGLTIYSRST